MLFRSLYVVQTTVVQTWYKYIKRKELDVYDDEKLSLPELASDESFFNQLLSDFNAGKLTPAK